MYRINIRTSTTVDFPEITDEVQRAVDASGVKEGICYIFAPHTTAAITVNEHADPSVVEDISVALEKLVPRLGNYRHGEGNAPAHIKAGLFGSSQVIFIEKGKLVLGIWQGIFFCEFDGPRNRSVLVKTLAG
jgi:secondary thiamine-phosphate synthase enzyme